MSTFVNVHGAWDGGWVWRGVARILQGADDWLKPVFETMAARARAQVRILCSSAIQPECQAESSYFPRFFVLSMFDAEVL
jgi:hypothetical protein